MSDSELALARWRLVLGRFADPQIPIGGSGYGRMDRVLEYLYGREYAKRGVRKGGSGSHSGSDDGDDYGREGGSGPSVLYLPDWLREVRELFPRDTIEIVERHALERYGMTELVTDPEVLRKLEPNYELLKNVLTFKGMMHGEVLEVARSIIRRVIEELRRRLAQDVRRVLWGKLSRRHRSNLKVAKNLDVRRTIRDNLRHYDP